MTGLTDQMKADFKVMKDVAQFTRVTPTQRQEVSLDCLFFCSQYISWQFDANLEMTSGFSGKSYSLNHLLFLL